MPENLSKLQAEIRRTDEKQAELSRNITILERVATQNEKRIQGITNDTERAEEALRRLQKELKRATDEQKENLEKIAGAAKLTKDYTRDQTDLKRKLEQLTREVAANATRGPETQRRSGSGSIFGR